MRSPLRLPWTLGVVTALFLAGCITPGAIDDFAPSETDEAHDYRPYVLVGVPDSGINPYHELYYREHLTMHPCTYIQNFPCDLPALELTLGGDDWDAAFEADSEVWASVEVGEWYWIPRTVFVAVSCDRTFSGADDDICILDDSHMHGTGTTSSIIMENPDALIAFKEGGSAHAPFLTAGIPIDIMSVSWGTIVPIPAAGPAAGLVRDVPTPIYVLAAGNDPRSTLMDSWAGDPHNIVVGGAYTADGSEELMAAKQPDVVSYYCRPTAQTKETHEMRESYCGTSFAAPTVAGGLSKVILGLRQASGYTGGLDGEFVDPVLGITVADLREALNLTASYSPESQYPNTSPRGLPVNPVAPWAQWGWGFYDGLVAEATLLHLLGEQIAPPKSDEARAYMEAVHEAKTLLYDW